MGSEGVVADVADDKGDDSSQGVVADLPTDKEDVSQEVVADRDLSGVETADLANDKGDVSEGVVADVADDKGDSLEGAQGVMHGLEGHKGNVCPHGGWDLSKKVMADPANDEEVVLQGAVDLADGKGYLSKEGMGDSELGTSLLSFGFNLHELTQAVGRIDSSSKFGLKVFMTSTVGLLVMTTFNRLKR